MNIDYEKMLFYNDLEYFKISREGKELHKAFKTNDIQKITECVNNYYTARNGGLHYGDGFHYDNLEEVEEAKNTDKYIVELYKELN